MKTIVKSEIQKLFSFFHNPKLKKTFYLSLLLIIVSTLLLSLNMVGSTYFYKLGDIANETIRVPWDITYYLEGKTQQKTEQTLEAVPLVFDKDEYTFKEKVKLIKFLFRHIKNTLKDYPTFGRKNITFQVNMLHDRLPEYLRYDKRILNALISYNNHDLLRKIMVRILNDAYDAGLLEKKYDNPLNIDNATIVIRTPRDDDKYKEEKGKLEELKTLQEFRKGLNSYCKKYTGRFPVNQQWAIYIVVKSMLSPNLRFNLVETKHRLEEASKRVSPVMDQLKKGRVIIREGDVITSDILTKIEAINNETSRINVNYIIGIMSLQLFYFIIFIIFLSQYHQVIIPDNKAPVIVTMLLVLFFIYTFLAYRAEDLHDYKVLFSLYLPIPFITMIITIAYNISLAMIVGGFAIFFCNTMLGGDYTSLLVAVSTAVISIFGARDVEKRTDFLVLGFVLAFFNVLLVIAISLIDDYSFTDLSNNIKLASISGILNTIAVMGFFPVFEYLFGLTTKFKLLELSNLNAPIFKKMLIKAPGTYNHSIMVANMSEAACKEIGANHLLARVGGYYHDIGKLENASIYIENKGNSNTDVDISPELYCRQIISHVTKGVDLAKENRIPEAIIDFIQEHHGDSMMAFFYHQALEQAQANGEENSIHKSDFMYPGPKPRTKETAIVMISDAIEAATRSLQDPSYVKLETMVKKIIYNKLNEGELENSDLTMQDLNRVQKALLRILNGIFHTRLEYPEKDEIEKLEKEINKNNNKENDTD